MVLLPCRCIKLPPRHPPTNLLLETLLTHSTLNFLFNNNGSQTPTRPRRLSDRTTSTNLLSTATTTIKTTTTLNSPSTTHTLPPRTNFNSSTTSLDPTPLPNPSTPLLLLPNSRSTTTPTTCRVNIGGTSRKNPSRSARTEELWFTPVSKEESLVWRERGRRRGTTLRRRREAEVCTLWTRTRSPEDREEVSSNVNSRRRRVKATQRTTKRYIDLSCWSTRFPRLGSFPFCAFCCFLFPPALAHFALDNRLFLPLVGATLHTSLLLLYLCDLFAFSSLASSSSSRPDSLSFFFFDLLRSFLAKSLTI